MIKEKLNAMIANAIKNKLHDELNVWRDIKTVFTNYEVSKEHKLITDDVELQLINKMVSQREESIEQYLSANRDDLANKEKKELEILKSLLPKEASEEELRFAIKQSITMVKNNDINYQLSMKDLKNVITLVKMQYPTANGGIISKIFKEFITK